MSVHGNAIVLLDGRGRGRRQPCTTRPCICSSRPAPATQARIIWFGGALRSPGCCLLQSEFPLPNMCAPIATLHLFIFPRPGGTPQKQVRLRIGGRVVGEQPRVAQFPPERATAFSVAQPRASALGSPLIVSLPPAPPSAVEQLTPELSPSLVVGSI